MYVYPEPTIPFLEFQYLVVLSPLSRCPLTVGHRFARSRWLVGLNFNPTNLPHCYSIITLQFTPLLPYIVVQAPDLLHNAFPGNKWSTTGYTRILIVIVWIVYYYSTILLMVVENRELIPEIGGTTMVTPNWWFLVPLFSSRNILGYWYVIKKKMVVPIWWYRRLKLVWKF